MIHSRAKHIPCESEKYYLSIMATAQRAQTWSKRFSSFVQKVICRIKVVRIRGVGEDADMLDLQVFLVGFFPFFLSLECSEAMRAGGGTSQS